MLKGMSEGVSSGVEDSQKLVLVSWTPQLDQMSELGG